MEPNTHSPNRFQRVRVGGLMRCCIHTIETTEIKNEPAEGDSMECRYCSDQLRWHDGAWEWVRPGSED